MRKFLIPGIGLSLLLSLLIPFNVYSQNKVLDSLQNALLKQKTDTGKVNTLVALANYYQRKQDVDKTIDYADQAIRLSSDINYKKGLRSAYQVKAFVYYIRRQPAEALRNYLPALQYAKEENNPFEIGIIHYQIATVHYGDGNYSEALKNCFASIKYLEGLKNKLPLGGAYMLIAHIYSSYENYGESIRYYYLSLKIYESNNFKEGIVNVLQEIGNAYFALGNFEEAARKFTTMLTFYNQENNRNGVATASRSLGEALAEQGNYKEALNIQMEALKVYRDTTMWSRIGLPYMLNSIAKTYEMEADIATDKTKRIESYNAALRNLEEAINNWQTSYSSPNIADAYTRMAHIQLKLGDLPKAKLSLAKGLDYSRAYKRKSNIRQGYYILSKLDSVEGNYKSAYENYKIYINYRDSLQNEETTKKAFQAKFGYDFSKKEDSLNLVQQLTDERLKQQQLVAIQQQQQLQIKEAALKLSDQQKELNQLAFLKTESELHAEQFQRQENERRLALVEKEKKLQDANLKLKNTQLGLFQNEVAAKKKERNLFVAGAFVFLMVGLVLFRNNRNKQKAYTLLEKQKAETDVQKSKVEDALAALRVTQSQLVQSEKMASLGELTAGIAHEIQNPLNFVNNFSDVNMELLDEMQQEMKVGNQTEALEVSNVIRQNLQKIAFHGKRADSIVKNMLQHSRKTVGGKEPTDINALVDEYLRLSYHGLRAKDKSFNAILDTHLDPSIGKVEIAGQEIGRVLLNLFNNAFYAVNEKKKDAGEGYEPTVQVSTLLSGGKLIITVKDNGTGIPKKLLQKIYQPFFTTKPTGEGTGLGLSMSYDIITKGHGGTLEVHTNEGEGSEFIIELPTIGVLV